MLNDEAFTSASALIFVPYLRGVDGLDSDDDVIGSIDDISMDELEYGVLCVKEKWKRGKIDEPGGRREKGETACAAAVREVGEECRGVLEHLRLWISVVRIPDVVITTDTKGSVTSRCATFVGSANYIVRPDVIGKWFQDPIMGADSLSGIMSVDWLVNNSHVMGYRLSKTLLSNTASRMMTDYWEGPPISFEFKRLCTEVKILSDQYDSVLNDDEERPRRRSQIDKNIEPETTKIFTDFYCPTIDDIDRGIVIGRDADVYSEYANASRVVVDTEAVLINRFTMVGVSPSTEHNAQELIDAMEDRRLQMNADVDPGIIGEQHMDTGPCMTQCLTSPYS